MMPMRLQVNAMGSAEGENIEFFIKSQ